MPSTFQSGPLQHGVTAVEHGLGCVPEVVRVVEVREFAGVQLEEEVPTFHLVTHSDNKYIYLDWCGIFPERQLKLSAATHRAEQLNLLEYSSPQLQELSPSLSSFLRQWGDVLMPQASELQALLGRVMEPSVADLLPVPPATPPVKPKPADPSPPPGRRKLKL